MGFDRGVEFSLGSNGKRVYVSGPISGHDREERRRAFAVGARLIESFGMVAVNPLDEQPSNGHHPESVEYWREAMKLDIKRLVDCECILMLEGWERSRGARLEKEIANALGMIVVFEEDLKGAIRSTRGRARVERF